jgi:hypothetical protein
VIETNADDPFTVQPLELVIAIRNVFEVTGFDRLVLTEQFMRSPAFAPVMLDKRPPSP